jgi:hypothetical protein
MTGVAPNPDIQPKSLLVLVVLRVAVPGLFSGRRPSTLFGCTEFQPKRPDRTYCVEKLLVDTAS